ncbi:MAG: tetratricopeptide (TPR) repeat protein [Pseudohongiellaceae bacterium]|jgi:tetratricopeptide (TPR) repeat protein
MNVFQIKTIKRWTCAAAISLPVLAAQAVLPTVIAPFFSDLAVGSAHAAEEKEKKKDTRKAKRTQSMNQKVYKKLQEVQDLIDAKDNNGALKLLAQLKGRSKPLNDTELATTLNLEAFVYYNKDQLNKAIDAYKTITTLEKAADGTKLAARYSAAQMYYASEQFEKGVAMLLTWFDYSEIIGASAYVLLGQGQYQIKQYNKALENVNKAVSIYKAKGKVPKENWYGLQRFLYQEKKDYDKVVEILKEMLLHYPKKQYWAQLSSMYGEKEMMGKQLAAYEAAYVQSLLTKEGDLTRMAYIFLAGDVPYKASKVMEKGIKAEQIKATSKNLELTGNALRASQEVERAIPYMEKAAEKSDKGELWIRLGNLYLNNDEFDKAAKAIKSGLKKDGVNRPDQAKLALGMAYFNMKNYKSARKVFGEAGKDDRSAKTAGQWVDYMDKEIKRQKSLLED